MRLPHKAFRPKLKLREPDNIGLVGGDVAKADRFFISKDLQF